MRNNKQLLGKTRIKLISDRDELERVVVETAALQCELARCILSKNEKVAAIATEYDLLAESLEAGIGANVKRLSIWALANREAEFGERQSITIAGHKLAYRRSPGKVAYLEGVKAEDALNGVLALDDEEWIDRLVTIKPALDKKAVQKIWESGEAGREVLRRIGITVEYPEAFRFEPDLEEVPTAALTAARRGVAL